MKKMVFSPPPDQDDDDFHYSFDVKRIVSVLAANDYDVSPSDARLAWEKYSDDLCAGWIMLPPEDDILLQCVLLYLKEV